MNQPLRPFRINIGFLVNQSVGYLREIPLEFPELLLGGDFRVEELKGTITLARTRNGIRTTSSFSALTRADCVRCLEEFMQPLCTDFEEIYTFENRPLSEDEHIIPEDGNIDFEEILREYLILEMPINPVCQPDCRGLCSECGKNLNKKLCNHQKLPADHKARDTAGKKHACSIQQAAE